MKLPTIAIALLLVIAPNLQAQSLDIGGIELNLGERSETALAKLKLVYDIRYFEEFRAWFASNRASKEDVGNVQVSDGKVITLTKTYHVMPPSVANEVYTDALRELKKRGGTNCSTGHLFTPSQAIGAIQTSCGKYKLNLYLPYRSSGGEPSSFWHLSVAVGAAAP